MKNKEQIAKIWDVLDSLNIDVLQNKKDISRIDEVLSVSNLWEPQPQLKQLDQSVFDGLDEKWRFAAVDKGGEVWVYSGKPDRDCGYWFVKEPVGMSIGKGYDTSNWQNSLIERDIAKELLEVDLSSELTGSELCKAMLARGDKYISGFGHHYSDRLALESKFADTVSKHTQCFQSSQNAWDYFVPINNQGEPLTAADAGL